MGGEQSSSGRFRLRRIRSCYAMCLPATSQACHDFSFFFADKKPVRQMEERGRYHQDKVERRYHQNKKILIPFIQKGNHSIPISSLISIQRSEERRVGKGDGLGVRRGLESEMRAE